MGIVDTLEDRWAISNNSHRMRFKVDTMLRFGAPDQFKDKVAIRLAAIDRAIAQYQFSSAKMMEPYRYKIEQNSSLFVKGFGNDINLLAAFRDLYFNSRELLDYVLGRLSTRTAGTSIQTPRSFLPFFKHLIRGDLDFHGLRTISFLKENRNYVFHIRKIRNLIKSDPSSVEFIFNTVDFDARMRLPLEKGDCDFLSALEVHNPEQAIANGSYAATVKLGIAFPEMRVFWNLVFENLAADGI